MSPTFQLPSGCCCDASANASRVRERTGGCLLFSESEQGVAGRAGEAADPDAIHTTEKQILARRFPRHHRRLESDDAPVRRRVAPHVRPPAPPRSAAIAGCGRRRTGGPFLRRISGRLAEESPAPPPPPRGACAAVPPEEEVRATATLPARPIFAAAARRMCRPEAGPNRAQLRPLSSRAVTSAPLSSSNWTTAGSGSAAAAAIISGVMSRVPLRFGSPPSPRIVRTSGRPNVDAA